MKFARDDSNGRIEVSYSKQRAKCGDCGALVVGRKGRIKVEHWAHLVGSDCDHWSEPMSKWHIDWQNCFPKETQEITVYETNQRFHRADVKLNNGLVIEFQHSSIPINQIEDRERVYGSNNMIWILDGGTLCKNSQISYKYQAKCFALDITIPQSSEFNPEYDLDKMIEAFYSSGIISKILTAKSFISWSECNGTDFSFEFANNNDIYHLESLVRREYKNVYMELFRRLAMHSEVNVNVIDSEFDFYSDIILKKKFWRRFIDHFTFPVFIDNLSGLGSNLLYRYDLNSIVKKSDFLDKYLKYC